MNKKILMPVIAFTIISMSSFGANAAYAQSNESGTLPTLIERIIEKFGLKKDDVQKVVDEFRTEKQAEMKKLQEERLNEAVTNGTITEEQKQLILKKHEEIQAEREKNKETWQNMTQEERQAEHEKRQAEMKAWADENDIDLNQFFGFKHGIGFRHGFMMK